MRNFNIRLFDPPQAFTSAEGKARGNVAVVEDVFARSTGIQDCVGDLNDTRTKGPLVINSPARTCRVAGDRAICNVQRRVDVVDAAPRWFQLNCR